MFRDFKIKTLLIIVFFLIIGLNYRYTYAVGCNITNYDCSKFDADMSGGQAPDPRAFICILARVINVFVLCAGVVLVYMILYGAIKLAMSWGDPKGYMGAQNTFLYAFIGFGVVIGFIALYSIMAQIVGLPGVDFNTINTNLVQGIAGILEAAGVTCN